MNNFNVNIEVETVMEQLRLEQEEKLKTLQSSQQREFNPKKYLGVNLGKQEDSKQLTIRILPFSKDNPTAFHKVHMHVVRVNNEVAPSGWKTITCSVKNKTQVQHTCPFCEMAAEARKLSFDNTLSEPEKKRLSDISFMNKAKEMWLVRCIERGAEEDGVKFWLFPNPKNGGIYQTITNICKTRKEAAERRGETRNIFDLTCGKDLTITIKRGADGKKKIDIVDDDEYTPLTTDIELGNSWINDDTKWEDLYPVKREDYMSILVEGGVPYWDKEQKCYVDKETYQTNFQTAQQNKIQEQQAQEMQMPVDYSVPTPIEEGNGIGLNVQQNPQPIAQPYRGEQPTEIPVGVHQGTTPQPIQTSTEQQMPPQPNWDDDLPF